MGVEQEVKPGSPEPLPINSKVVAVDLGGTLISSGGQERSGATRLLQGLKSKDLQVVLMSGEGQWFEDHLFVDFPHWKELIDTCLWNEQIHGLVVNMNFLEEQRLWLDLMAEKEPEIFKQIEKFLKAGDGGKYPPLWNIGLIIDDGANSLQKYINKLGAYGFTAIDPSLQSGDSPDSWVNRVLNEVDQWRPKPEPRRHRFPSRKLKPSF